MLASITGNTKILCVIADPVNQAGLAYAPLLAGSLGNPNDRLKDGGYMVEFIKMGIGPIGTGVLVLLTGMPRVNKRLSER